MSVSLDRRVWVLRGVVKGVDAPSNIGQILGHSCMQRVDVGLAIIASADARLIGYDNDQPAGSIEGGHRLTRPSDPVEILPTRHIAPILVQHAVAIEEQGRAERLSWRGFGHATIIGAKAGARRFQNSRALSKIT